MSDTFPPTERDIERARRGIQLQWDNKTSEKEFLEHQARVCAAYEAYLRGLTKILHKRK